MGRKLNTSTPTVIQTELVPLDENFAIEANGTLEQWYYDNTTQYAPDRSITPLILSPKIMVADKDSQQSWDDAHVTKSVVAWSVMESDTWVDITSASVLSDYELSGNNLIVHKNVSYSQGVTIMCKLTYVDPRDNGIYITTQETVLLTCNRDANVVLPEVAITSPSARSFNPLVDGASTEYDFDAVVTNSPDVEMQSSDIATYEMDGSGTEEIAIGDGVVPTIDIRYPDSETQTDQEFVYRQTANGEKPDEVGAAFISKIKGNTVAWNQLLNAGKLVDMGLPSGTLWATCNIDVTQADGFAASPFQYECSFFSWGNVDGHNPISTSAFDYNWGNANAQEPWYEGQPYGETQGNTLTGNIPVGDTYDAARVNVGSLWCMPTSAAFAELLNNCDFVQADGTTIIDAGETNKLVTVNGVVGIYLKSKINGNLLFFACSGNGRGSSWYTRGNYGYYWSSSLYSAKSGRYLYFSSRAVNPQDYSSRFFGYPVRPVITKSALIGNGKNNHKYALSSNNANITDVTLTYGSNNEPSTVAQFEADYERWFGKPLSYEEYDAGSLKPVLMQSVKTTGFNQWDGNGIHGKAINIYGRIENANGFFITNYIKIFGGLTYYFNSTFAIASVGNLGIAFYDASFNFLSGRKVNERQTSFTVVAPTKAHYMIASGLVSDKTTGCINISNPSKDGTYEPYEGHIASVPVTSATGRLLDASGNPTGSTITVFPDGLKKIGNIQDEIFVDGVVKAIKRVGSVDLGSLTWTHEDTYGRFISSDAINLIKNGTRSTKLVCPKYISVQNEEPFDQNWDKVIYSSDRHLVVHDSSFSSDATGQTFKAAMQGVMLYYELATPETYVLDPVQNPFIYKWFGIDANNNEVLAETLPWYVSGQDTSKLKVDAMWGEKINVVLRAMMPTGALSPSKAYAALTWRIPDVDTTVVSYNGSAVRSDTNSMTFGTIVNINGRNLEDSVKAANLRFKWVYRKNFTNQETVAGWSQGESDQITIQASNLRSVKGQDSTLASTLVFPYVYCLGAWTTNQGTETGYTKPTTTKNGVTYYRIVD